MGNVIFTHSYYFLVVDEQNAQTEEAEYSKELDECKEDEKEEDTKEFESQLSKPGNTHFTRILIALISTNLTCCLKAHVSNPPVCFSIFKKVTYSMTDSFALPEIQRTELFIIVN